jgi:hypothetical protein
MAETIRDEVLAAPDRPMFRDPGLEPQHKKVQTRRPAEVDRLDFLFARFRPKR